MINPNKKAPDKQRLFYIAVFGLRNKCAEYNREYNNQNNEEISNRLSHQVFFIKVLHSI